MKATKVTILGQDFIGAKDGDVYLLAVPSVECLLGWRIDSLREKIASKSFKAFCGKTLATGKTRIVLYQKRYTSINVEDFIDIIRWEAKVNKSDVAIDYLSALATETLQRRIDAALGEEVLESEYERQTKELFQRLRDEARINFKPKFTDWLKADANGDSSVVNFPKEVNRLKKSGGMPITAKVADMSLDQMIRWASIGSRYDILRQAGIDHTDALMALQASTLKDVPVFEFN